jgi:hypothetical protein
MFCRQNISKAPITPVNRLTKEFKIKSGFSRFQTKNIELFVGAKKYELCDKNV